MCGWRWRVRLSPTSWPGWASLGSGDDEYMQVSSSTTFLISPSPFESFNFFLLDFILSLTRFPLSFSTYQTSFLGAILLGGARRVGIPQHISIMAKLSAALLAGACMCVGAMGKVIARQQGSLPPVTSEGNAFWADGERFYVRGVAYQPGGAADAADPLLDMRTLQRDIQAVSVGAVSAS
jgi:hypothetical protein